MDDESIKVFKARLVGQGCSHREGVDYFDTYAPVARITSIRVLIAIAALNGLHVHQMDVKTAFLNGDLDEKVYMKQPEGFVLPGYEHKVCKLLKSLYGLTLLIDVYILSLQRNIGSFYAYMLMIC